MKWFLYGAAALHALFMVCELFPWSSPVLMRTVGKKLPGGQVWTPAQHELVATIVHNCGIYNGIVAAGILGTATLKSLLTAVQALVGLIGLALLASPT